MRTKVVKSNKYVDLLALGGFEGVASVQSITRLRPTEHGMMFRELVVTMAPEVFKMLGMAPRGTTPEQLEMITRNVAHNAVNLCESMAMEVCSRMTKNKALATQMPSYASLLADFVAPDPVESDADNVVSFVPSTSD
jgi:hypothetical protein